MIMKVAAAKAKKAYGGMFGKASIYGTSRSYLA